MFGFIFGALQYLHLVRGYSPLEAALALVLRALSIGAMSRVVAPASSGTSGIAAST